MFMSQWTKPAPYGQHEKSGNSCGPMVHQRITHTISDAIPGVLVFTLVFFLYGHQREYLKITFYCLWQCHYIHRGFINPWITKQSSLTTPIGISLRGLFPNLLYSFPNSDWIVAADYNDDCYKDPRFIIGIVYLWQALSSIATQNLSLRKLRTNYTEGYSIPHGCLFKSYHTPIILTQCWNGLVGLWELGPQPGILVFIQLCNICS